jgi:hypothetical protein
MQVRRRITHSGLCHRADQPLPPDSVIEGWLSHAGGLDARSIFSPRDWALLFPPAQVGRHCTSYSTFAPCLNYVPTSSGVQVVDRICLAGKISGRSVLVARKHLQGVFMWYALEAGSCKCQRSKQMTTRCTFPIEGLEIRQRVGAK